MRLRRHPEASAFDRVVPVTGILRCGFGALLLARPALLARVLAVDSVTAGRTAWLGRMIAARELALGVGTLAAARNGGARGWLVAQMISDTGDAAAVALAARSKLVSRVLATGFVVFAAGAVAAEAAALPNAGG